MHITFGLLLMMLYKRSFRVLTIHDAHILSGMRREKIYEALGTESPKPTLVT